MRKMTQANLEAAFAGESQARMKYTAFATKAEKEGYPEVARLFHAIAYAEEVHAINHLRQLGGIGKTADNLAAAMGGENYEVTEMYPAFDAVARKELIGKDRRYERGDDGEVQHCLVQVAHRGVILASGRSLRVRVLTAGREGLQHL